MPFISTAIAAFSTWAATHVIGAALVRAGVGLLLGFAANAIQRRLGGDGSHGFTTEVQLGGDVSRQAVLGKRAVGGHPVYFNEYGSANKYNEFVIVLSDGGECDGLEAQVLVDGKATDLLSMTIVGNEDARYKIDGLGTLVQIRWYSGRAGQDVDTELVANSNPAGRWTSDDKLTGMAYVAVRFEYDKEKLPQIPQLTWIVRGLKLYDWRKDSTNGGSGSHRWDDRSTWEFSRNAAVIRYNVQRGFFIGTERVLGQGVPIYDLMHDLYTDAANVCDEDVTLGGGGTEKRYLADLVIGDDMPFRDALDEIDKAMAGIPVERQGAFGVLAGASSTAVATITDEDLVEGETVDFAARRSRAELVNTVFPTFTDPNNKWETAAAKALVDNTAVAADGERLAVELSLDAVTSQHQARRIAKILRNENRAQKTATIPVGFNWVWLQAGDWLRWNSALFGDVTYRIVRRVITTSQQRKIVMLTLAETSSSIYGWSSSEEAAGAVDPDPSQPGTQITTVAGFALAATTVTGAGGEILPHLRATWTPPADATIDQVVVWYRKVGTSPWQKAVDTSPEDGELVFGPVMQGVSYEARASIVTTPYRLTTFTSTVSVTASAWQLLTAGVVIDTYIGSGAVTTPKIAANAVTQLASALSNSALAVSSASTVVQTLVVTRNANTIADVVAAFEINSELDGRNIAVEIVVKRGSTTIYQNKVNPPVCYIRLNGDDTVREIWLGGMMNYPGIDSANVSGSQTYTIEVTFSENGGGTLTNFEVSRRYLRILERAR